MSASASKTPPYDPRRFEEARQVLAETGRQLYHRGWSPATSSNYSLRIGAEAAAITVSGKHKGTLRPEDIMAVDLDGTPLTAGKPSAETLLHCGLYRRRVEIGAVLHTHSMAATVLSRARSNAETLVFADYEIQKAFPGITTHDCELAIPVVDNSQDIPGLAARIDERISPSDECWAYIIRGHGIYAWGRDLQDCLRHLEALEYLLACELEEMRLRP